MVDSKVPSFTTMNELVSINMGGRVVFATDDFFSPAEGMVRDSNPVFSAGEYTAYGKWMDGWETRRKRTPGHDWAVLQMATVSLLYGVEVDTAFFIGNYAPRFSIQAAKLTDQEMQAIPKRYSTLGSAPDPAQLEVMTKITQDWKEVVPMTKLKPGNEDTRHNYVDITDRGEYTHIRLNLYPDGGVARLRVYGVASPDFSKFPPSQDVDLVAMMNGGVCQGYSNAHYSVPRNLIKPYPASSMEDGWETARRLDRPTHITLTSGGHLSSPGEEWAILKLGARGVLSRVVVDTQHFRGNYPDTVRIEGGDVTSLETSVDTAWTTLVPTSKLSADRKHEFSVRSSAPVTHIRVTMTPDGGISRVYAYGRLAH